jgi:FeS assembly SUF system protein
MSDFDIEEVDGVQPPRRARVDDIPVPDEGPALEDRAETAERKRDYLEGFLAEKPADLAPGAPGGELYENVVAALKEIFDPEIPVDIYELGLIYGIDIAEDAAVKITMTLTSPSCPVAETLPPEVEDKIKSVEGVSDCKVEITWEPTWDKSMMSQEAQLELGFL